MTAVVGIIDSQKIIIGADSCGSTRYVKHSRKDEKVFFVDNFLIGVCQSFRGGNLLRYKLLNYLEKQRHDVDDMTYMNTTFVDAVKDCLSDGGTEYKAQGEYSKNSCIVGYKNNLYKIDYDYQVGLHYDNYMAIGSGEECALGSLYSTEGKLGNRKRAILALEASAKYCIGVGPPFVLKEMKVTE